MVTQFILYLGLFIPAFLFSGEFVATVNQNQVTTGESFMLNLTLTEASPKEYPVIESLRKSFTIHSEQKSSNTTIVNSHISVSFNWIITLSREQEGEIVIPTISIETTEGTLFSKPIHMQVTKGNSSDSNQSELNGTTFIPYISRGNPYKNEPFIYTAVLSSKLEIMNVGLEKLAIEDAIVEPNGEPTVHKKIVDGVKETNVEFSYLITPLKSGPLKIPSIAVQGFIPAKFKSRGGVNLFFNMLDSDRFKPFTLATEEITLDVQAQIAGMHPWLPAKELELEEIWDESQVLRVGEPISRGVKISAVGLQSNQLPHLEDNRQIQGLKIYSDKPETKDEIIRGTISSFRKEQYTIIPQTPKTVTLPEISIAWWDVTKNEKRIATIKARTLEILPAITIEKTLHTDEKEHLNENSVVVSGSQKENLALYIGLLSLGVISLGVISLGAILWVISLKRKITRLTEKQTKAKTRTERETVADVKVENVQEGNIQQGNVQQGNVQKRNINQKLKQEEKLKQKIQEKENDKKTKLADLNPT